MRTNRIAASIIIIGVFLLYYLFIHPYFKQITSITFSSSTQSKLIKYSEFNQAQTVLSPSFIYSLDSECKSDLTDSLSQERQNKFNNIFDKGLWSVAGTRSGGGSSLSGAYDWIKHLSTLFEHYSIRSVADIPCGDTYWQFSLREINTIEDVYFGGDISTHVIKQNQRLYGSRHFNKLFHYWDLVNCPIPTYTYKNSTHEIKHNRFDLIIVRDALQHMHIKNGLKAVRNVIMSGAKFFAVSTFPPNEKASAPNMRSLEKNESLPFMPIDCVYKSYCSAGNIKDGDFYHNNINCHPFNFPLNKAILVQLSHASFSHESDEMHIYKIDDELKRIVEQYDKACLE